MIYFYFQITESPGKWLALVLSGHRALNTALQLGIKKRTMEVGLQSQLHFPTRRNHRTVSRDPENRMGRIN